MIETNIYAVAPHPPSCSPLGLAVSLQYKEIITRSSWLNCALRDDEAVLGQNRTI